MGQGFNNVNEKEHFQRLNKYYEESKFVYDLLLGGSKHFGFYPNNKKISEKEAQLIMQDLVGKILELSNSMKVLDAGCGQGVVSTYLSKKYGCEIEGITMVPFEIEKANTLAKKLNISDKVNYSLMDYSNTIFTDNYFNAIYTTETLVHSTNVRKTLNEFFRILKKDGRIALFEYSIDDDDKFSNYEMAIINKVIQSTATNGLKEIRHGKFQEVLREAGFKKIKAENISKNVAPSVYRLKRFFSIPYFFVKLFHLQSNYPNLTSAIEFAKMGEKDLFRYNIFTAEK